VHGSAAVFEEFVVDVVQGARGLVVVEVACLCHNLFATDVCG
jgi:hypothetical protein